MELNVIVLEYEINPKSTNMSKKSSKLLYKTKKFDPVQKTIDSYIRTPIANEAKYRKLANGGGGCIPIIDCITSAYTGFYRKLLNPTNMA